MQLSGRMSTHCLSFRFLDLHKMLNGSLLLHSAHLFKYTLCNSKP